jgi:hypothetical protein
VLLGHPRGKSLLRLGVCDRHEVLLTIATVGASICERRLAGFCVDDIIMERRSGSESRQKRKFVFLDSSMSTP